MKQMEQSRWVSGDFSRARSVVSTRIRTETDYEDKGGKKLEYREKLERLAEAPNMVASMIWQSLAGRTGL